MLSIDVHTNQYHIDDCTTWKRREVSAWFVSEVDGMILYHGIYTQVDALHGQV